MPNGAAALQRAFRLHVPELSACSTSLQPPEQEASRKGKARSDLPDNIFCRLEIPVKSHPAPSQLPAIQPDKESQLQNAFQASPGLPRVALHI